MNTPTASIAAYRLGGLALLMLLGAASAQAAQPCRIDGKLVIRAAPCPVAVVAAALPSPDAADAPRKRPIAEIMREREAANRSRATAEPAQADGASVLRERMGAL